MDDPIGSPPATHPRRVFDKGIATPTPWISAPSESKPIHRSCGLRSCGLRLAVASRRGRRRLVPLPYSDEPAVRPFSGRTAAVEQAPALLLRSEGRPV